MKKKNDSSFTKGLVLFLALAFGGAILGTGFLFLVLYLIDKV